MTGSAYHDLVTEPCPVYFDYWEDTSFTANRSMYDVYGEGRYYLSPGCEMSMNFRKEDISPSIPLIGKLPIDIGMMTAYQITLTGKLEWKHNEKDPIQTLNEMIYVGLTHCVPYRNSTDAAYQNKTDGAILLTCGLTKKTDGSDVDPFDIDLVQSPPVSKYRCLLVGINYTYPTGAELPSYTIILDVVTKGS